MLETGHEYGNMQDITKIIQVLNKVSLLNIYIYIYI